MRWFRKGGAISDADSVSLSRNIAGGLRRKPCEEDLAACGRPNAQGGGSEANFLSSGPTVVPLGGFHPRRRVGGFGQIETRSKKVQTQLSCEDIRSLRRGGECAFSMRSWQGLEDGHARSAQYPLAARSSSDKTVHASFIGMLVCQCDIKFR
eukprot:8383445-Pyramimonas_sp.AAC.1